MINGQIKGNGNSRLLKGYLPDTYDEFKTLMESGQLPVDVLFNPTGWSILPTFLNKNALLKDETAAMFGFGLDAVPDDALALLATYTQYWWKKQQLDISVVLEPQTTVMHNFGSGMTVYYSSEIEYVSRNKAKLKNPSSITIKTYGSKEVNANVKGKYFYTTLHNILYFMPSTASASNGSSSSLTIPARVVRIESTDVGDSVLIHSVSRDAYPDLGISNGYQYTYIGSFLNDGPEKSKIELVSYVGTGTSGPSNPTSMTFSVAPDFVLLIGYKKDGVFYSVYNYYVNSSGPTISTSNYGSMYSVLTDVLPTEYASGTGSRMKKSENGKTISWYHQNDNGSGSSVVEQRNALGITYCYLGFKL